jgi:catechol 2,3-dioxygenase-like lactoylglutathione lyase family enzyme
MNEVHEVTLIVKNIDEPKKFYEDILELKRINKPSSREEFGAMFLVRSIFNIPFR